MIITLDISADYLALIAKGPKWWGNIGSRNGLVQSSNKPFSEPILTTIPDPSICHSTYQLNYVTILHIFRLGIL